MIDALPLLLSDEGYQISRSVRLRSSASAYLTRTMTTPTSATKWSWSGWVKRGTLPAAGSAIFAGFGAAANQDCYITFGGSSMGGSADQIGLFSPPAGNNISIFSSAVYRDPSAWYHVVVSVDTTQGTAANRVRIYVNGTEITYSGTPTYPTASQALNINSARAHYISGNSNAVGYLDGYLTEVNFIDGQALTPSSFGETDALTGVWRPKKYVGTYGTNGFYLNFSDNSNNTAATIGKDYSGNGNNWTPNNISVTAGTTYDSMLDVPTPWGDGGNGRGNYCVLNPIVASSSSYVSGANLNTSGLLHTYEVRGTMPVPTTGKWYFEVSLTNDGVAATIGLSTNDVTAITPYYPGSISTTFGYQASTGNKVNNAATAAYGATYGTNDVVGVAVDTSAGKIWFSKNGVWQASGDPAAGTNEAFSWSGARDFLVPAIGRTMSAAASLSASANFGQRPFAYTPPSGFKALNTQNLPTPTIAKGNQFFDVSLYTGTGNANGDTLAVTNSGGFQPDLVWTKDRTTAGSATADAHLLADAVRGAGNELNSNTTAAEYAGNQISAFSSNGFTARRNTTYNQNNVNGVTYVGWQWKEGATQGFDIVTYTGNGANRTIAHNLGVAPRMMIVKQRDAITDWYVYHTSLAATDFIRLNLTNAKGTNTGVWNSTAPTSTVFSLGSYTEVNANTKTYVAYLFAEVAGFSKFGSYTGNGSADGPFVYLGFRPRWVLFKVSSAAGFDWLLYDSSRNTYNVTNLNLRPDLSDAEGSQTANNLDFLSNGFKIRGDSTGSINPAQTIIYAAFAENPFKYSLAR